MDNRFVKGEETKAKILEAALVMAANEGTRGLSAKKVADAAGVSKSNIFHHFGSVDGILDELLRGICQETSVGVNPKEVGSLEALFDLLGLMTFTLKGDDLLRYRVLFSYYYDVVFHHRSSEDIAVIKNQFIQLIIKLVYDVEGITLTDTLAELIVIDLDGMGMHYMLEMDSHKYLDLWAEKSAIYIARIRQG